MSRSVIAFLDRIEEQIGEARDEVIDAFEPESGCDASGLLHALIKLRNAFLTSRELRREIELGGIPVPNAEVTP